MYFGSDKNNTNIDNDFGNKNKKTSKSKTLIIILLSVVVLLAMYFLVFKNISAKEFKLEKTLALNGNTDIVINQYEEYIDPGYKAYDNKGNDLKSEVIISGNVDTSISGDYTISYTLDDIIKERHITVIAKKKQQTFLVLKGESTIFLKEGEEYTEPGYTVKDNLETDLEDKVIINGNVESIPGTYKLKYTVTNQSGITVSAERTIIVINSDIGINYEPQEKTNGKVKIIVNIKDNYYDRTELPNKEITKDRYIAYEVNENGIYKFIIYSKDGTIKEKEVEINNIYKEPPSGKCEATVIGKNTKINVTVTSSIQIEKYVYNNKEYKTNTFTVNEKNSKNSVTLYDIYNNSKEINCQTKYVFDNNMDNINPPTEITPCNNDWSKYNQELDDLMKSYGYKTRYAVAAAAEYLASFPYDVAYFWGGKQTTKGINPNWGCEKECTRDNCTKIIKKTNSTVTCAYGLDCAGYTAWAFAQAGFDKSILRTSSQSTGMWGDFNALKHRYSFKYNQDKVNEIKPGDIVHIEGHVGIVLGTSDTMLKVANEHDGIRISFIKKSNGKSTNGDRDFDNFVLFDDFFKLYGN